MSRHSYGMKYNEIIVDSIATKVADDIKYNQSQKRRNSPEEQQNAEMRKTLSSFAEFDKERIEKLNKLVEEESNNILQNTLAFTIHDDNEDEMPITLEEIAKFMNSYQYIFEVIKKRSQEVIGTKKYGHYENIYIKLIEEDVRFVAFAPVIIFDKSDLAINVDRLAELSDNDFNLLISCIKSNGISSSDGFKKYYSKKFNQAIKLRRQNTASSDDTFGDNL